MANKKTDLKEDVKQIPVEDQKEQVLLTEAEFERKQRLKTKERINRVTRVAGMFAIILFVYLGAFDVLFELSFFGALFTKPEYVAGWEALRDVGAFDDPLWWGSWMGQLGITVILVAIVVLMVYFLTYTIVDIIAMVKQLFNAGRDITRDLSGNVKDTVGNEIKLPKSEKKQPAEKKKNLFEGDDVDENEEKLPKEKKTRKRRNDKVDNSFGDLTTDQLDALLSGAPMDEVLKDEEEETPEVKPLF